MNNHIIQSYNLFFRDFVKDFDASNPNILRKIIHTYIVADKCFQIACRLKLTPEERNFAYLLGLCHDLGRFVQWQKYGTYNDHQSVDHGDLSATIIDGFTADQLQITDAEKHILSQAAKYHTKPYSGNDPKVIFYRELINNADAYANVLTTANGAQPMTCQATGVTPALKEAFLNLEFLRGIPVKTKLDRCLGLTACCYYVTYDFLRQEILAYGYPDIIYQTFSQYLDTTEKQIYRQCVDIMKQKLVQNKKA